MFFMPIFVEFFFLKKLMLRFTALRQHLAKIFDCDHRRLGNGAAFYGKRKSNFYGESDRMKKEDPNAPDPLEDYQGPSNAGYFQWQRDEDGQMRPVTRMKGRVIERSPKFWDRAYGNDEN